MEHRARHLLVGPSCPKSKNFFWYLPPPPPSLSLPRLATDMRCLLGQSTKFKMVKIEAVAQGATVCNFLLAPT